MPRNQRVERRAERLAEQRRGVVGVQTHARRDVLHLNPRRVIAGDVTGHRLGFFQVRLLPGAVPQLGDAGNIQLFHKIG